MTSHPAVRAPRANDKVTRGLRCVLLAWAALGSGVASADAFNRSAGQAELEQLRQRLSSLESKVQGIGTAGAGPALTLPPVPPGQAPGPEQLQLPAPDADFEPAYEIAAEIDGAKLVRKDGLLLLLEPEEFARFVDRERQMARRVAAAQAAEAAAPQTPPTLTGTKVGAQTPGTAPAAARRAPGAGPVALPGGAVPAAAPKPPAPVAQSAAAPAKAK